MVVESISLLLKLPAVQCFGWMVPLDGATQFHIISVDLPFPLIEEIPTGGRDMNMIFFGRFSYLTPWEI